MCQFQLKKSTWINSVVFSLVISASAEEEADFLDISLDKILTIPLDVNAVNILESYIHKKNEQVVGYKFMHMGMNGNLPSISYAGLSRDQGWGAQMIGTIRTGNNDNHYRLGDRLDGSLWLSRIWDNWISSSIRISGEWWGNIHGENLDLTPKVVPTANPNIRGGRRINMLLSAELYVPQGGLKGQHIGFEIGLPVYQSLKGPQLETDWTISAGWQWTF